MTTPATVICYGESLWDLPPGGKTPGGAPMNVALRLANFGVDAQLVSRVGNDELGRELLEFLRAEGLGTEFIQVDRRYPTGSVNVDVSDPRAVRYDIAGPVAWDFIDAAEFLGHREHAGDVVVYGSLAARHAVSRDSLLEILDGARLKVFDVNLRPPFDDRKVIEQLLALSDWVKLNETELDQIGRWSGADGDIEQAIRHLGERYALDTICVTLGEEGAVMLHEGSMYAQPAFDVAVVDTIGCGDAFLGSWLSQMLAGANPQAALTRACAVGAHVAAHAGANPVISESRILSIIAG